MLQKPFLTTAETADFLGVTVSHVYYMMAKRIIPYYKPSHKIVLFAVADLMDYVERGRVSSSAELSSKAISLI